MSLFKCAPELQLYIFSHIPHMERFRLRLVNRSLYHLLRDPSLWHNVHLRVYITSKTETRALFRSNGRHMRRLHIDGAMGLVSPLDFLKEVPNVVDFMLRDSNFAEGGDDELHKLLVGEEDEEMGEVGMCGLDQLRQLSFVHCKNLSSDGLLDVLRCAPGVTRLTISECTRVLSEPNSVLEEGMLRYVTRLELLKVEVLTVHLFDMIKAASDNLEYVIIKECNKVTDDVVGMVAALCTKLQLLDVTGCVDITNTSVLQLKKLTKLRGLYLRGCRRVHETVVDTLTDEGVPLEYALTPMGKWRFWKRHVVHDDDIATLTAGINLNQVQ